MKLRNEMIVICLIFFILISISAVSAGNNNTDLIANNNNVNDDTLSVDTENILNEQDSGNFSDLNTKINNGASTEITLENDYNYTAAYNSGNGISITKSNIVIDGKGHTIDGNGQSRLLYVTASGVTLKNIKFTNGNATHGGAVYFNQKITIINCTFSNSKSTGTASAIYGGGAIYGSNVGAIIQNCTFENNIASRNGGALCILPGSGYNTEITDCTFINNHADSYYGGAIYIRNYNAKSDVYERCIFKDNNAFSGNDIYTAAAGIYNLTNSVILNPTVNSIYLGYSCNFYANNNWWGNTKENFNVKPTISQGSAQPIMTKWNYLDMNINYKLNTSEITLNNVYDSENVQVIVDNNCRMADLTFTLSAVNATVPENITLINGKATVEYARLQPTGLLNATYEDISVSKEIVKPRGDFNIIQELINNATSNNVELLRDYVYDIYWDSITDGIAVTQDNLVIDGKGYTIDAKGKSRIFKIVANNVTLKNIKFINGYSSYAGAIYYSGQNINILNCTFENNAVENTTTSNGLGGAMYINPSAGCTIEDCTFISNHASNRGGAIFLFSQTGVDYSLNRNIFIKNIAGQAGGAVMTNGQGTINISNSIFLDNTNYQVYSLSNYVSLDYNWWGNTINDYTDWPNVATYADYNWYFLNMEINETEKTATISLNNYYDGSVSQVSNFNLPKITLGILGVNVTIQNKVTLDDSGKATISYNPTSETGSITASIEGISLTKSLNKLLGEFGKLDELISTSTASLIELDKNYTFTTALDDDFVTGIKISKSNIVIDGKGHTIDAKGQSRIFYVTGSQVTLKNIKFINAKSNYAGAVYGYGDNLYIINCTFVNNTAETSGGGAVYWYPDSYSCAINCTFIDNKASYGGAILAREYQSGITSDIINCTFLNNHATGTYGGGAIYDYSENYQAEINVYGSTFFNNTASKGSAILAYIAHAYISNSIFLDNPGTAVYADGSYTYVDYNWWGNTYDNRTASPNVNNKAIISKWIYLDIIPNISDSTATISINNVFDNETQTTSTYSTTYLPSINVKLTAENATLAKNNVTLDNTGKGSVSYVLTNDSSITASYGEISQTRLIQYGSFNKLQALIRNANDDSVITLTRDYVWGMGDTITEGIVVYNKNNITIDGNGHIIDGSGKSRIFGVNIGSRNIVFKNLIIQNGKYGGTDINKDVGGGMVCESPDCQIINCTFKNNFANGTTGGGALYVSGDGVQIIGCTFIDNHHDFSVAGAVYIYGHDATIKNTVFENNTADTIQGGAGALYLLYGGSNVINCTFKDNTAKYGGAIVDSGYGNANNIITDCTFIGNTATEDNDYGGGAIYSNKATITNSVFVGNHAKYGSAIYNIFNESSVDRCLFTDNEGLDVILWVNAGKISNSIFLNNDIGYNYIISSVFGGVNVENNWFGNTWNDYQSEPWVTNLATMNSWLFLNATDMSYDFDTGILTMKLVLLSYNNETNTISSYDLNKAPSFNLTLTTENVTFDKNSVEIGEEISGTSEYRGNVVAEYENVIYTVPFKFQQASWIDVVSVFNLTVGDKLALNDDIVPYNDEAEYFLRQNNHVIYISNDTSIFTVDKYGKITGVSQGIAKLTILYDGCDAMGRDKYLPSNATVLVNVTCMATHFNFIFEPPTTLYVGDSGNLYVSVYDAKNKSVSGSSIDYINNNPDALRLSSASYTALSEGIANITISYAGTNKYLPVSYDLIINVTRKTPTISVETDYLEMIVSKYHYLGVSISPSTLGITASSNDTSVATVDNSGAVQAIGVGVAKLTFRTEGNNYYKPAEVYVIVNVTDLKTYIDVPQDVMNLNYTESLYIQALVRNSTGGLVGYNILFSSNDTSVATVEADGKVNSVAEGIVNITLTFPGQNEYGPSTKNVTIIVKKVQTEILVNDTVSMFAGERINLDATLNYPQAGKLQYDYVGDNIVVDSRGNVAAISEGIATVTITATITSEKYTVPSSKTVTVKVTRRATEVNIQKDIFELNVLDEENINATTTPKDVGVLKYSSNDTSVATVDQFGNIIAKGEGVANITAIFEGNSNYLPSNASVIVKVTTISTQISVVGTLDVEAGDSGNLGAILTPTVAGTLTYSSNDTGIVTVDDEGNFQAIGGGSANITIEFAGNERYVKSVAYVIINVARKNSQINANPISIFVDENKKIIIDSVPEDAELTYLSNDESIVTVDTNGNITGIKIGKTNITISYAGSNVYLPCKVNVTAEVVLIPTEIIVNKTYGLKIDSEGNVTAKLNHPEAGSLVYESDDENIVTVDNNGILETVSTGSANITISYAGNEKYAPCSTKVLVTVYKSEIPTEILVNNTIELYVGNQSNVGAEINPANAGNLIYSTTDSEIIIVDNQGNIHAIKVGSANITITFPGNDRFNSSSATVKVTVLQIPTQITSDKDLKLNLTENTTINASLNYPEAGNLVYNTSNSSVVTVDENGFVIAEGVGNAVITISYSGNENYTASEATVNVEVVTVATSISVDSSEVSLFVDDTTNVNASLNYPEAGSLVYASSNPGVVTVDGSGNLVAVGEGEANVTITFDARGKYLASNKTVKVTVSRIATKITVDKDYIELFVDDIVNVNATFSHPQAGDLIYDTQYGSISLIDEFGNITAKGEGITEIYISYLGDNKYLPSEKIITVSVSRIPTKIEVNDTMIIEVGSSEKIDAVLTPYAGSLTYTSSNSSIIDVWSYGNVIANSFGTETITVSFAGNYKYAPSNATVTVSVKGRETEIEVTGNIVLTVEDTANLDAKLIYSNTEQDSSDLKYVSSDPTIVSVDRYGKLTAHKKGNVTITVKYAGLVSGETIVNYPSQATVNVSVISKASEISISANKVTLTVDENTTVTATLKTPHVGQITFVSANESIATVDANGLIKAIGKGTTTITVSFAGNDDYLPSNKTILVVVKPIPSQISVNDSFEILVGNSINLNAILNHDGGQLSYSSYDEEVVVVDGNGKVTGLVRGTTFITVKYEGNSRYDEAVEYVTIYVTLNQTSISVDNSMQLNVGDISKVNAVLNPNVGYLEFVSSDENIVRVDGSGNILAIAEGNATITVKFGGNLQYEPSNAKVNVTVVKNTDAVNLEIDASEDTSSSEFSVNLPKDATGTLTVYVDGKEVETKQVQGGTASVKVNGLSSGDHEVTLVYSGDKKYGKVTKSSTIHIYSIKIDKNKDIVMVYASGTKYTVHLTRDTQAMAGETVTFIINGKKVTALTNKYGYSSVKIDLPSRAKPYTVSAQFGDVKVVNKVTVKTVIIAKNLKLKKSARNKVITVSLKKVNGKYLSGKTVKLRFFAKNYKAKTNKYGKAVFKLNNKYLNKLKIGKKYRYRVYYGKDRAVKNALIVR